MSAEITKLFENIISLPSILFEKGFNQELKEGLEILFNQLMMLTVPNDVLSLSTKDDGIINFSVRTEMAAEAYLASLYGLPPKLIYDHDQNVVRGEYGYAIPKEDFIARKMQAGVKEVGWEIDAAADEAVVWLNNKINRRTSSKVLDEFEREQLNNAIRLDRLPAINKLHRLEANSKNKDTDPMCNVEIVQRIRSAGYLPECPVINYGSKQGAEHEALLSSIAAAFFKTLNQYQ